jgi:transposase-like protein
MNKRTRQTFSPEFKRGAVRRLQQDDIEGAQLARELGIARNKLYLWKAELKTHGDAAFPGQGGRTRKSDDTTALKAEVKKLREENEILKKAAIYFAKESG